MPDTRQTVREKVDSMSYDLDGTIEEAVAKMQELATKYPGAEVSYEDDPIPYDNASRYCIVIYSKRPETDAEMEKRLREAAEWQARREAQERREYEALKKKFGG